MDENFKKKLIVRELTVEDYSGIAELELLCFPNMTGWSKDQIESHIKIFPEGQICIEYDGKVVASSSSLIIDFEIYGEKHSWDEITANGYITNHDSEGDTLYGIEIMVHPNFRGMRLAGRLYDARKELARELNLKRIIIGGRIPKYQEYSNELTPREYVDKVLSKGLYDPVLTAQTSNGFTLKRILRKYLDRDRQSVGYATLLEWNNLDYQEEESHYDYSSSRPVRICSVQYQMRKINNFEEFSTQCEYFVDVSASYKSDFILFPEIITTQLLSFMKYDHPGAQAREVAKYTTQYLNLFQKLAIQYNINIIGGSHFVEEEDALYNVAFLFRRDGSIEKQYKIHITPNERHWWGVQGGESIDVFDTDRGKISIQICYDIEFPELSRIAVDKGAQIIFVPFCTDERHGYLRVRYCSQARSIENQIYVAIAGNVGNLPNVENMDIQYAQSAIFTPSDFAFSRDGIGAEANPNIETVVIHDVDLEQLKKHRQSGTTLNWRDRRKDLYEVKYKKGKKNQS